MKKILFRVALGLLASTSGFAQETPKTPEQTIHVEATGGYMKNTVTLNNIDGAKQPGFYLSGLAESDKHLVTGSLNLVPASGKQSSQTFGSFGAYGKVLPINGGYRTNMILGANLETTPTTSKVAPAIGFRMVDGWSRIEDHQMITTLQPVGFFQSKVNGKTYRGYTSEINMSAKGTAGDSRVMVQFDFGIGMLYGGNQKTGQNDFIKQNGIGMNANAGMMFGFPVSDSWAVELGFATNRQQYKVSDANGTKLRTSSDNSMVKIGVKGRIPVKVKGKVAKVI